MSQNKEKELTVAFSLPKQKYKCAWCDVSSTPDLAQGIL